MASLNSTLDSADFEVKSQGTLGIQITGTWVGTISFYGSIDHNNYVLLKAISISDTTSASVTSTAANGLWLASVPGLTNVKIKFTAYISGQAEVILCTAQSAVVSGGGSSGGGGAVTIADGADVVEGSLADAAITTDSAGTINAKLRGLVKLLNALDYDTGGGTVPQGLIGIALPASGGPVAGGISTNPIRTDPTGTTTQPISAASLPLPALAATSTIQTTQQTALDAINSVLGLITGAAIITDIDGTVQRYLRGIIKLAITAGGWLVTAQGDVASGSSDSGNPVKIGGKGLSSLPTVVTTTQRVNGLFDLFGRLFVRTGSQGFAGNYTHSQHNPSANTKATITLAAAGAGIRRVCTSLQVTLASSSTTAPAAIQLTVALIDGASGGSTYLWGPQVISLPATAGAITAFIMSQCWKPGTANTAMTLEFSAAGGANTIESVDMDTTTVQDA